MVSIHLQCDVEIRVQELLNMAQVHYDREFPFPSISYKTTGRTAGWANYTKNEIKLNHILLNENVEAFMEDTIPHEIGHLLTWQLFKDDPRFYNRVTRRISHHGWQWKAVCKAIGHKAKRTHDMDTSKSARKTEKVAWKCDNCGGHCSVSPAKSKKMMNNSYHHKCGHGVKGKLTLIGNVGKTATHKEAVAIAKQMVSKGEKPAPVEVKVTPKPAPVKPRTGSTIATARRIFAKGLTRKEFMAELQWATGCGQNTAGGYWHKLNKG